MTRQLAKIIADSVSPAGVRLTTMEVQIPRIVLAEFNTHRVFSRNSASSRAIPVQRMLKRVMEEPYVPERWGVNGKGMQDHGEASAHVQNLAVEKWLQARDSAVHSVRELLELGIHKQLTNRLLEPFMWHTVIVTATEYSNWTHLRNHPQAHPAIQRTAAAMEECMSACTPTPVGVGTWHLPFVDERDEWLTLADKIKVSCARCARVSYLTHDGKRSLYKDIELYERLASSGHMSPLEHAATPMNPVIESAKQGVEDIDVSECFAGNFRGWVQHRKYIRGEHDMLAESRDK